MNLLSIRIITADVDRLIRFYEAAMGVAAIRYSQDFAELPTQAGTLALGSTRTLELFGGEEVAQAMSNRTVIMEFRVDDVDAEYRKLVCLIESRDLVQEPSTMPWGNRSLLFRDPDGNLVNFFQPVALEAIRKFEAR